MAASLVVVVEDIHIIGTVRALLHLKFHTNTVPPSVHRALTAYGLLFLSKIYKQVKITAF